MDEKIALHTAARRYRRDRFSYWFKNYEELQRKEKWQVPKLFEPGWDYSDEAYQTFPRYRIDKAIEVELERLTGNLGIDVDLLRTSLLRACDDATEQLEKTLKNPIAQKALHEEGEDYKTYIKVLTLSDLAEIEPLPFRRVITESESEKLRNRLKEKWGIDGFPWFPLKAGPVLQNLLAFHTDYFEEMNGRQLIREAFNTREIRRVFQLHEFGDPEYEIEANDWEPWYGDGGEVYSTSKNTDWVVYASHESSITISGDWLVQVIRQEWPGCDKRTYGGPYSTEDLRGTWNIK